MPNIGTDDVYKNNTLLLGSLLTKAGLDKECLSLGHNTVDFNEQYVLDQHLILDGSKNLPLYSVSNFWMGLCWTWDVSSGSLRGMVWHFINDASRLVRTHLDQLSVLATTYSHAFLPALVFLRSENNLQAGFLDKRAARFMDWQIATGHHSYKTVIAGGSSEDNEALASRLEKMTKNLSGLAQEIATSVLCLQRLVQLAKFILDSCDNETMATNTYLIHQTRFAKRHAEGLSLQAEQLKHNSNIMVQTMLSLTTQHDQKISIELAASSKTLAEQAIRDSSSMKAIAAVTMCFLPGTFMSSLFAIPMFDWSAEATRHVSSQFWMYWAITLPLTLLVIIIWQWWTNRVDVSMFLARHKNKSIKTQSEGKESA